MVLEECFTILAHDDGFPENWINQYDFTSEEGKKNPFPLFTVELIPFQIYFTIN
jgi:hypothetical protein